MGAVGSWWSTALSVCKDDSSWRGGIHQRLGDSLVKEVCSYVTAGRGIFELSWPERWMYWTHFPKWACPRNLLPSLQHNAWLSSQYVLWLLLPVGRLVELEKKEEQVSYKGRRIPLESSSSFQLKEVRITEHERLWKRQAPWDTVFMFDDIEYMFESWESLFNSALD